MMSRSMLLKRLYKTIKSPSPTATSLAAIAIIKKAKSCPSRSEWNFEIATKPRLTAFSMISVQNKSIKRFLRTKTPKKPIKNKIADNMRYVFSPIIDLP